LGLLLPFALNLPALAEAMMREHLFKAVFKAQKGPNDGLSSKSNQPSSSEKVHYRNYQQQEEVSLSNPTFFLNLISVKLSSLAW
jgi:hypothetical protein